MTLQKEDTIEEMVGQLCFVRFRENKINDKINHLVANHHVGGVFLTNELFEHPKYVHHITDYLQRYAGIDRPLFIGIDAAHPLTVTGMTQPIPHNVMEQVNNRLYTKQQAEMYGEELRAVGINTVLAPDLQFEDNVNDKDFVDAFRPKMQHAVAAVEGYKKAAVQPFPSVDEMLAKMDLFHATDKGRVRLYVDKFLQKTPVLFIDTPNQNLHHHIDRLKNSFDYEGLIVANFHDKGTNADQLIEALHAGVDAFLLHDEYDAQVHLINELVEKVKAGQLSKVKLQDTFERILEVKTVKGFGSVSAYDRDAFRQKRFTQFVDNVLALDS